MKSPIDPAVLHGDWLRSPEEDTATEVVYRPASYAFPPSRGREGLRLSADGTLIRSAIGATDLHTHRRGRWRLEDGVLHLEYESGPNASRALELVDASSTRLATRR